MSSIEMLEKENREIVEDEMLNLLESRPYLAMLLNSYLNGAREEMDGRGIEYSLRARVSSSFEKVRPRWAPVIEIVVEREIGQDLRFELANAIDMAFNLKLEELSKKVQREEGLTDWAERITIGIGTEEEFEEQENEEKKVRGCKRKELQ